MAALALGVCFILPAQAKNQPYGEIANMQARHIATVFPGRMTGTPAEMLSADYIRQQFADMGYKVISGRSTAATSIPHATKRKTGIT
jgi:alkaline phosphatase isozyme conversion protein